jgi:hypothetical protein
MAPPPYSDPAGVSRRPERNIFAAFRARRLNKIEKDLGLD